MSVAAEGWRPGRSTAYIQPVDPPMPPITFPYNPGKYTIITKGSGETASSRRPTGRTAILGIEPPGLDVEILMDAFSVPPIPRP